MKLSEWTYMPSEGVVSSDVRYGLTCSGNRVDNTRAGRVVRVDVLVQLIVDQLQNVEQETAFHALSYVRSQVQWLYCLTRKIATVYRNF